MLLLFRYAFTHRLLSSSFLGLPHRILNMNHKKEPHGTLQSRGHTAGYATRPPATPAFHQRILEATAPRRTTVYSGCTGSEAGAPLTCPAGRWGVHRACTETRHCGCCAESEEPRQRAEESGRGERARQPHRRPGPRPRSDEPLNPIHPINP